LIEPGTGVWESPPGAPQTPEPELPPSAPQPALPVQTVPPPAYVLPGVGYAGFWIRFLALVLDVLTLSMVESMVLIMLGLPLQVSPDDPQAQWRTLATIFVWWLYCAFCESSPLQATLGKRALDLMVTDLRGQRLSFARATARFFSKILSAMIVFIGFFMVAFSVKKQALHDQLAGTLVLSRAEEDAPARRELFPSPPRILR
jgi:uncharacterized RDD family membrane protein YckC